jgi:thiosulfate/3-mercaptopyruvate sulfurtransferase
MTDMSASLFVSTEWLAANLGADDLVVVDGSFIMPGEDRNAHAEYLAGHIPGAVFFDINEIADHETNLPHMLPTPLDFADAVQELGISETMSIVVYDSAGLEGVARVWWTLRLFGARDVRILNGGLPKWKAEGRELQQGTVQRAPRVFIPQFDAAGVVDAEEIAAAAETGSAQILDARSAARFQGKEAEPRAGVRPGHIPGSLNLPWRDVITEGSLRPVTELRAAFAKAGLDLDRPVIATCGSGVTAAILLFALAMTGKNDVRLYDGSWTEWGARHDLPVERS